jgi:hypothetical protein
LFSHFRHRIKFEKRKLKAEAQVKQMLDQKYIDILGLQSTMTDVVSSFNYYNRSTQTSYESEATLISSQGSYNVELNHNQTSVLNQETLYDEENISGSANYYLLNKIKSTTIGNNVLRTEYNYIQYNDSSGLLFSYEGSNSIKFG